MGPNRGMFSWRITRALFGLGIFVVVFGVITFVRTTDAAYVFLILVGFALLALATRGPWDSEFSGRNRSVMGFRARA